MARYYNVRLFKIKSTHGNVRTDIVDGVCQDLPMVDSDFIMTGPGLEFGKRLIRTTPVKSIARVGETILFETRNSTYTISIIDEGDDEAPKIGGI